MTTRSKPVTARRTLVPLAAVAALVTAFAPQVSVAASAAKRTSCPPVIAHRGNGAGAPENTVPAFVNAVRAGAATVELDVRFTRSNLPVVLHDETVDRTTNGTGPVASMWARQLRTLRVDVGPNAARLRPRVPSLYRSLRAAKAAGAQRYVVELKVRSTIGQLYRVLSRFRGVDIERDVVVESSDAVTLLLVRAAQPELATALLTPRGARPNPADVRRVATYYLPHYSVVDRYYIEELHAVGLPVYPWTANRPRTWRAMTAAGADGIVTDRTRKYLAASCS